MESIATHRNSYKVFILILRTYETVLLKVLRYYKNHLVKDILKHNEGKKLYQKSIVIISLSFASEYRKEFCKKVSMPFVASILGGGIGFGIASLRH